MHAEPLMPLLSAPGRTPDFLAPAPCRPGATLVEELEVVRCTESSVIQAEMAGAYGGAPPPWLSRFADKPDEALEAFAVAVMEYWERAIAPDWERMQAVLERDVIRRARTLAVQGAEAVFEDLHPRVHWRRPLIEIEKRFETEVLPEGRGLVLVPLIFSRGALMVSVDEPSLVAISYRVAGTASIWEQYSSRRDGRLELLFGRGRGRVLRVLHEQATTREIAARLGMAESTVSEHLSVLVQAELVSRRRSGQRVYYQLNVTGESLCSLLVDPKARAQTA